MFPLAPPRTQPQDRHSAVQRLGAQALSQARGLALIRRDTRVVPACFLIPFRTWHVLDKCGYLLSAVRREKHFLLKVPPERHASPSVWTQSKRWKRTYRERVSRCALEAVT